MKKILIQLILSYLRIAARIQLQKNRPLIIGITGSAGKSSTKKALVACLNPHFRLKVSYHANSETGLPLNILGLQMTDYSIGDWARVLLLSIGKLLTYWPKDQIYLAEMAIDSPSEPKNMSYLLKIIRPQIGIFLNAAPVHSANFDHLVSATDPEQRKAEITALIATEKGKLITQLPKTGLAVLNLDDSNVQKFVNQTSAQVATISQQAAADWQISHYQVNLQGTEFEIKYHRQKIELNFPNLVLPRHYGQTFAVALAVSQFLGIELPTAAADLMANFKLPAGRSSLIPAVNEALILDSSYNNSLKPAQELLNLLTQLQPRRRLALLGDMRELDQEAPLEHHQLALAAAKNCDQVFLVGPLTNKYVWPVLNQKNIPTQWFESAAVAARQLKKILQPGDLLLVKGSQNALLLETAVERLMANPDEAEQLLCRRGAYWAGERAKLA